MHKYANEDVSLGAWFIGLEVEHIDDHSMCCPTELGMPLVKTYIINQLTSRKFEFMSLVCELKIENAEFSNDRLML